MQNDEVKRCQFQASIVCCKRFSFQLKIFNFQWSVYQLMRAAKNMGGVSFCAQRCVAIHVAQIYNGFLLTPIPLLLDVLHFNASHVRCSHWNLTSFTLQINWRMWPLLWLSWRKMDKSHIVQIYIDAFLRCPQIWKVETLIGRLNFASGF